MQMSYDRTYLNEFISRDDFLIEKEEAAQEVLINFGILQSFANLKMVKFKFRE